MRPTIKSLQDENTRLCKELMDERSEHGLIKGTLTSLQLDLSEARDLHRVQLKNAGDEMLKLRAEMAAHMREAQFGAEILRLTRELLAARTEQLVAATGRPLSNGVPTATPGDLIACGTFMLSRKEIEEGGRSLTVNSPFIGCIKYIREKTGLGLKEAKDICDMHFSHMRS